MRHTFITCIALLATTATALADVQISTYHFRDVLKPHGQARSIDEQHVAARACGASAALVLPNNVPAYKSCMLRYGWQFDHIVKTTAASPPNIGDFVGIGSSDQDSRNFNAAMDAERMDDYLRSFDQ
jgi:hypothetical protein